MVHLKASTGCDKCRERRIKCDEAKPNCQRCVKRGIVCPGYRSFGGVVFVNASKAFAAPRTKSAKRVDNSKSIIRVSSVPQELTLDPRTLSIHFFFQNFVLSPDRDPRLSRGHFDNLLDMYCTASPSSPISLASSVMAACIFQQYHDVKDEPAWQIEHQMQAHAALKKAILDPAESLRDETLMAIVLMDYAARLSSNKASRIASQAHMVGALALADRRSIDSFTSTSSQALLASLRSNVLLYILWNGERDGYRVLKRLPDVHPGNDSLAAALHYLLVKALILDVDAGAALRSNPDLQASEVSHWVIGAANLIVELDDWLERTPLEWKLTIGFDTSRISERWCPELPPLPVIYLLGQWHCIKLGLIKIISNMPSDPQTRHQADIQGRIVFGGLRSLFPHFETQNVTSGGDKSLLTDFMHRAARYAAPIPAASPSVYKSTTPTGQHYLLNLLRWALTHVLTPAWTLQPQSEFESVKQFLLKEKDRIVGSLEGQERSNRLAALF